MQIAAREIDRLCDAGGAPVLIYCGLRDPYAQARLYRQSRPRAAIVGKCQQLRAAGFALAADIIESVGRQDGPHRTNAAPFESWHQFGQALDAVPFKDGKLCYDDAAAYRLYAAAVRQVDLYWAGDWTGWSEKPHCQLPLSSNPLTDLQPSDIERLAERHNWRLAA